MADQSKAEITPQTIKRLVEGKLPYDEVKGIVKRVIKDKDRFWKYLEALQEHLPSRDRILLRISEHLYIVRKGERERIVKCDCGYEFGDYRVNWKTLCRIRVRTTEDEFAEVYATECRPDPGLVEAREFYCPGCLAQLAVDVVPKGYPIHFEFLPDLDAFYREWLGKPLADESPDWFQDLTPTLISKWPREK